MCATLADGMVRIIPADAGSTYQAHLFWLRPRDHPRGCGEHMMPTDRLVTVRGSSPRMRGAQRHRVRRCHQRRIIPADAGSTFDLKPIGSDV